MRPILRSFVLSAAVAAVGFAPAIFPAPASAQVAPEDAKTAIPVKMVVLYSSGVGYFQHAGTVDGDSTTELRFKTGQINDILKSLVLQDKGGSVSAVTYPSQDPLAKTLRSFQVDIASNPSIDQLLNQLRGAKITVALATEKISGTILGVEKRTKPAGENKTYEIAVLNLISGGNIRSVELSDVRDLQLDDPNLQDELAKALAAVASSRDQDMKPVSIHFKGKGQREVLLGYVVETPVWKASYRLILNQAPAAPALGDAKPAAPAAEAKLQGWAIIENQTDNDWKDVQLSLVSGRPISFVEDLYQPLYVPRPIVRPQLFASLNPQTYEGGMEVAADAAAAGPAGPQSKIFARGMNAPQAPAAMQQQAQAMQRAGGGFGYADQKAAVEQLDAGQVQSIASAASLGDLFEYTVGSVTLPRQTSAMIPIVTDPIQVEKLSIFNQSVLARHPLNGARVKNTTGKHLLAGPVTVIDGSAYAGDAQINDVPPGQERLLSYGIDLQMLVDVKGQNRTDDLLTGKIVKGVLELTHKYIQSVSYEIDNKSDHDKTLVIEHPIAGGNWTLIEPKAPQEKTDTLYRFQSVVPGGKQQTLVVKEQSVQDQRFAILGFDTDTILVYSRNAAIPKSVKDALIKAADMKRAVVGTQQKIDQGTARENWIVQDQKRMNETLRTIDQKAALYARLMQKLSDEETELDKIGTDRDALVQQKTDQQKALEDYLGSLSVE